MHAAALAKPSYPPYRRCECCRWADMRPTTRNACGYGIACLCPSCHRGQAGVGKDCCNFEREPGTDDDLEKFPRDWMTTL